MWKSFSDLLLPKQNILSLKQSTTFGGNPTPVTTMSSQSPQYNMVMGAPWSGDAIYRQGLGQRLELRAIGMQPNTGQS